MVSDPQAHPEQIRLEEKAAVILATNPDREQSVEAIFGPMEDWIFEIGDGWKLMLMPFSRRWWFFDRIHDDWQDTGFEAGEAVFYVDNHLLEAETVKSGGGENRESVSGKKKPHFCAECGAAIQVTDRFCRGCGRKIPG